MPSAKEKKIGAVMVIGAGITGIQASLDLANAGYYVYLIEKKSAIGGGMAQLDKTFPTNDCAMCIISPKLVECGRHLNIEVITNAEVLSISGNPGNFVVNIHQIPRYINTEKCTACGDCIKKCPVIISNEFDQGISKRKAIFKRYPQAYPNTYCITKLSQSPCKIACPANLNIQGYIQMAKTGKYQEALSIIMKKIPLPGTIARICPHPCENECRRIKIDEAIAICSIKRFVADQIDIASIKLPTVKFRYEKVAIIGAGPAGLSCAYHLALRNIKSTIFEALPIAGGTLAVGIPAYRLPRKILQKEINYLLKLGIEIKFNTTIGINSSLNDLKNYGYQSIFLATGVCGCCRVIVENEIKFACVDGPEFNAHQVDFDALFLRLLAYKKQEQEAVNIYQHKCLCSVNPKEIL